MRPRTMLAKNGSVSAGDILMQLLWFRREEGFVRYRVAGNGV